MDSPQDHDELFPKIGGLTPKQRAVNKAAEERAMKDQSVAKTEPERAPEVPVVPEPIASDVPEVQPEVQAVPEVPVKSDEPKAKRKYNRRANKGNK